jgi:hypothetical protein
MYILNKIKKLFLHKNYLGKLKLSTQKRFENILIFFLYSVRGASIGEYSSTVKNRQK